MGQSETAVELPLLGEPLPVELMNTLHLSRLGGPYDVVGNASQAAVWVDAVAPRLPVVVGGGQAADVTGLGEADGGRLRALRDALRVLAAEVTGAPPQFLSDADPTRQEALDTVNGLSGLARVWPEMAWPDGAEPEAVFGSTAGFGDRVVSLLARQAVDLFTGPDRARLRACLAPGCDRYFIKQHSRREWCTSACGNRARVARHYRRHHGGAAESGGAAAHRG
ncbi:ABATE domain-containing protein [Streptomyces sp. TS71-3]|uniref:CGNR zinc finger domain-containing protein n=1 Tax=Streptomyces sp. TS71-3 TaxID=2733862 RepID=UPI001BB32FF8|nr:CGNR zinc finger domain-containing protein [Streptomyces sp. TS71-3]